MRDFTRDHRALSINTATVRKQGDLVAIAEACARAEIKAISPWRDQVATVGLNRAVAAVKDAGLELSGYCRGGMFPADAARLQEATDDNRRAVDEAVALGAPCLVLVVGGLPQYSRPGSEASKDIDATRALVEDGIATLLDYSRKASLPLAIEPLHPMYAADRACVNTMSHALDICDRVDPGAHRHARPCGRRLPCVVGSGPEGTDPPHGQDRLLAYHVCDWLAPTTDLLLDRGMMGDGVIDLRGIREAVEAVGYAGYSEVEIFSENNWWKKPMEEVLATCIERHRAVV